MHKIYLCLFETQILTCKLYRHARNSIPIKNPTQVNYVSIAGI